MILLDTDHCVFFIRGHPEVVSAFEAHSSEDPAVSVITVGELYFGALRSGRPTDNLAKCEAFVDRVTVLGLDREVMRRFAEVKAELYGRGRTVEDPDLLIAATALTAGIPLVSHNTSHFSRIEGLQLLDWCERQ